MPTYYTSEDEMKQLFGEEGVSLRMDDVDVDEYEDTITDIIADATETCDLYLRARYDQSDLATSKWVRRRATFIACYYLSRRRGNPAEYVTQYEEARADLEDVKDGDLLLPGVPVSASMTPTMSNFVMDARNVQPMRVRTELSVGDNTGDQFAAYHLPYFWI